MIATNFRLLLKRSSRCFQKILPIYQSGHFELENDVSGHFALMLLVINAESIVSKEFCQSIKVYHFEVANNVLGHLASMLLICRFLKIF